MVYTTSGGYIDLMKAVISLSIQQGKLKTKYQIADREKHQSNGKNTIKSSARIVLQKLTGDAGTVSWSSQLLAS